MIAQHKALIARMQGDGHDVREQHRLLDLLVEVQALFEKYRRTIVAGLDDRVF